jgi:hypothetical protein
MRSSSDPFPCLSNASGVAALTASACAPKPPGTIHDAESRVAKVMYTKSLPVMAGLKTFRAESAVDFLAEEDREHDADSHDPERRLRRERKRIEDAGHEDRFAHRLFPASLHEVFGQRAEDDRGCGHGQAPPSVEVDRKQEDRCQRVEDPPHHDLFLEHGRLLRLM